VKVVGIDVGALRKGFHAALVEDREVRALLAVASPEALIAELDSLPFVPEVIAIDGPPRATRRQDVTRLSERQLHRLGYRVQWTRRASEGGSAWMENSERMWQGLAKRYPQARLVECFPTAQTRGLADCELSLPLRLLAAHSGRRDWKDLLDATICAETALRVARGTARQVGHDPETGEKDELGPIYF
jgi:predicted nuclease with RNAse H fold